MNAPETIKRREKIMLVGLWADSHEHLTARARAALENAVPVAGVACEVGA